MSGYSIYELKCPSCHLQYSQMIPDEESKTPIFCPSCGDSMEKIRKLSGAEILTSCTFLPGGG